MNQDTFIKLAEKHLYRSLLDPKPLDQYTLNRSLQYLLCCAFSRLEKTVDDHNITEKDVCLLVESWIMAQGTEVGYEDPLVLKDLPVNAPQKLYR